jgi:hypothetical protein
MITLFSGSPCRLISELVLTSREWLSYVRLILCVSVVREGGWHRMPLFIERASILCEFEICQFEIVK